ncbi:siphovirus Gp157 family protein [Listeria monocytogenes]|uniref:siphovirus Gp157 family protein n=1 Tax=Listeria monocytogenes TaxID=1639 RepID=UPI003204ABA3
MGKNRTIADFVYQNHPVVFQERFQTPKKLDKAKLKDDLKKGIDVPGAVLVQTERLQIK